MIFVLFVSCFSVLLFFEFIVLVDDDCLPLLFKFRVLFLGELSTDFRPASSFFAHSVADFCRFFIVIQGKIGKCPFFEMWWPSATHPFARSLARPFARRLSKADLYFMLLQIITRSERSCWYYSFQGCTKSLIFS